MPDTPFVQLVDAAAWQVEIMDMRVRNSDTAGAQRATTGERATAHKIARIVYHRLKYGEAYVEQSAAAYEEQ